MYYTTMCWKIIEIKANVNLVLLKNLDTAKLKYCGKQEVSAGLWEQHMRNIKEEGGSQL